MVIRVATSATAAAIALLALAPIAAGQSQLIPAAPATNGYFGAAVGAIPDVNGDGFADVVIGAPGETAGGSDGAGRIYVYSGATGVLLYTRTSPNPSTNGLFGNAVAGIPDVDGDGRGDIVVGAPQENAPDVFACGRVYIFSGRTGVLLRQIFSTARITGGDFGSSVSGVPDLDGDGRGDIVIGAPNEHPGASPVNCGRAYIYSGATGALYKKLLPPLPQANGSFGFAVAGLPDANGDGFGDVVIGAPRENPFSTPVNSGRVHLYNGNTGTRIITVQSPGLMANGFFGSAVAGVPDTNGDGRGDFAVGAPQEHPGNSPINCGRAYIYSGATGRFLQKFLPPNPVVDGNFGISVAGVADSTGDGFGDVIVGAWKEGSPPNSGAAHLYSGATGQRWLTVVSPNTQADGLFGVSVAGLSNAGGTTRGDWVVGASTEEAPGRPTDSGRAYIFRR